MKIVINVVLAQCILYCILTIFTRITAYFVFYNWSLIENVSCIKFGIRKQRFGKHINGRNKTNKY